MGYSGYVRSISNKIRERNSIKRKKTVTKGHKKPIRQSNKRKGANKIPIRRTRGQFRPSRYKIFNKLEQKRRIKRRRTIKREKKTIFDAVENNSRTKKTNKIRKRRRGEEKFENQKLHRRRFGQLAKKSRRKTKKEKRRADENHARE